VQPTNPKFSKSTQTTGSTVAKIQALLPRYVSKLVESGRLVVQSSTDAPATANSFGAGGVEGYYDPTNDVVYVIADNVDASNLDSVVSHELYHRAEATDLKLKAAVAQFDQKLKVWFNLAAKGIGTGMAKAAYARVIAVETKLEDQLEEFKAYLVSE
jgi:antirestriction protein ArdC